MENDRSRKKNDPRYVEWGRVGGQRSSERYGVDYFKFIGQKGGNATYEKYGKEHMSSIARGYPKDMTEDTSDA